MRTSEAQKLDLGRLVILIRVNFAVVRLIFLPVGDLANKKI